MKFKFLLVYILIVISIQADALKILSATSNSKMVGGNEFLSVQVTFDSPMIPIDKLSEEDSVAYFNITPKVTGHYRWLSTSSLEFLPDTNALTINTRYSVTIPKGLKSVDGKKKLEEDYKWSFSTKQIEEDKKSNNYHYDVRLKEPIFVKFNQAFDIEKCSSFISINPKIDFTISYPKNIEVPDRYNRYNNIEKDSAKEYLVKNILKIQPKTAWEKASEYRVNISNGFPGLIGNLTLKDDCKFSFSTFHDLRFWKLHQYYSDDIENGILSPDKSFKITFNNDVDWKSQYDKISIKPEVNKRSREDYYTSESFAVQSYLKPETEYEITINKDLCDIYGTKLGKDTTITFKTGNYSPFSEIKKGFKVIEYNSPRCIALNSCNADSAIFIMKKISTDNMIPILESNISFNESYYYDTIMINMDSVPGNQFKLDDLYNNEKNIRLIRPIFLDSVLKESPGFVLAQLVDYKPFNRYSSKKDKKLKIQKSLLQVTNIGVTAKPGSKNIFVAVVKLDSGKPIFNAKLEIRDSSNTILWNGFTDNKGTAYLPSYQYLSGQLNSKKLKRLYLLTSNNNDCVITRLGSEYSECDISLPRNKRSDYTFKELNNSMDYKYSIFLDRGIYLPGDSLYVAGIVRYVDEKLCVPKKLKLAFKVSDSNKPIWSDTFSLSELGSFNFKLKIPQDAKLDDYFINGSILKSDSNSISLIKKSFRVGEFIPEQLELDINTDKDTYNLGDSSEITVNGRYLYGAPVTNKSLEIYIDRIPNYNPIKSKSEYEFTIRPKDKWRGDNYLKKFDVSPSYGAILDSSGEYSTKISLAEKSKMFGFRYTVQATVKSGHSDVSGTKEFIVHPGNYYIGLKSSKTFFPKDSSAKIELVTVTPEENVIKVNDIRISILKRCWIDREDDDYDIDNKKDKMPKDSLIKEMTVSTDNFGITSFNFRPAETGEFVIMAEGNNNATASAISLYVYGKAYGRYGKYKEDEIELQSDKSNYKPGDTAKILVPSNFKECKALVTIERENVISSEWHDLDKELNIIRIPIKESYLPNVYVSILLQSKRLPELKFDSDDNDLSKPQCKIGLVDLKVSAKSKEAKLEIVTNKQIYDPRDSVEVTISLKDSSKTIDSKNEIIFYAVDEGVLSLTGYKTPDPYNSIYLDWRHKVFTFENRKSILGYFPKEGIPELIRLSAPMFTKGGAALNLKKRGALKIASPDAQHNSSARKFFKTCAYFNPSIKLSSDRNAKLKFKLPDNLTTFRLMAVIHSESGDLGSGEAKISVNKNIMINPRIPGFVRSKDTVSVGVLVENTTLNSDTAKVALKATGIILLDDSLKQSIVDKKGNKEFIFRFTPEPDADTVKISLSANMNYDFDAIDIKIPVVYDNPKVVSSISGSTKSKQKESLSIPEDCSKSQSNISLDLYSTAMGGLKPAIEYLEEYPYKCAEQQTSRILPYLFMEDVIEKNQFSSFKKEERKKKVQDYFYNLVDFEARMGGFSYWSNWAFADQYLTSYIFSAIDLGAQQGYKIDNDLIEGTYSYLHRMVTDTSYNRYFDKMPDSWISQKAYALSVLLESKNLDIKIPERIIDELEVVVGSLINDFDKRSLFTQVCLLRAIRSNRKYKSISDSIISNIKQNIILESSTAYFEESYANKNNGMHHSRVRTTSLILQTLLEMEGECLHAEKIVKWLKLQQGGMGHWRSTQDNIFALRALAEYYNKYEEVDPSFKGLVKLDKKSFIVADFNNEDSNRYVNKVIPFTDLETDKKQTLEIKKSGKGRLYYKVKLTSLPNKTLEAIDKGFKIEKSYETVEGEPIDPMDFTYREPVRVKIKVYVHRDREYVVVNDPIPAGCIIVDERLNTIDQHIFDGYRTRQKARYNELRDWSTWNHYEYKRERCELYANKLRTGVHEFTYVIKPIVKGKYYAPPPYVEEMYSDETFGRGDEVLVEIK